jgi:L-lactate dehydrogenase complex protein LldF
MQVQTMQFKARAGQKLADQRLQQNLTKLSTKFVSARAAALTAIDFAATRAALKERRNRALENLDVWLETFEREASRRGVTVLYAETTQQAARLVADIARRHDVKKVIKTKSMVTEEMRLNEVLGQMGVQSIETDLGEYILQINDNEPPSHIIAPVVHKDKDEIADLFARTHQRPRLTEIPEMTREAREVLRPHFMTADMGVTGGNFLVAQTGSVALVTNEGNEGMCTVMPRVHVAVTGIEKILPTLEDLATAMRLLPRSATGQATSNYFSVLTGPRGPGDQDGPEHMYVVLVDGGRTGLIGGDFQEMLRCIRCGACMNHCPVYQKVGGHAYGWVYPGPMGSVLTPSYVGLDQALDLPHAIASVRSAFHSPTCCASCARSRSSGTCDRGGNVRGWQCGAFLRCIRTLTRCSPSWRCGCSNEWGAVGGRLRVCRSLRVGRTAAICRRRWAAPSGSSTRRSAVISDRARLADLI